MDEFKKREFDEAELEAKKAARERRIAALKAHQVKPGDPPLNPTGKNGRKLMATMRRALDIDGARETLCAVAVEKAIDGDVAWARFCAEYDDGKPVSNVDLTSSDGSMFPAGSLETSGERRARLLAILDKGDDVVATPAPKPSPTVEGSGAPEGTDEPAPGT